MEKTLRVLNKTVRDGVIEQYAIGRAVAAIFYIEPFNTNDLDVFFYMNEPSNKLDILAPLYDHLLKQGYKAQGEAVEIEGWPVQFLPACNPLLGRGGEGSKGYSVSANEDSSNAGRTSGGGHVANW